MSDIPRYKINPLFGYLKDAKEGKFCEYRDYLKLEKECTFLKDTVSNCMKAVIVREAENARLKVEVERLRASSFVTAVPSHQYERIIKAGDAMASMLQFEETLNDSDRIPQSVQNWNAAKEGKPNE
jgi:hypothetical protein